MNTNTLDSMSVSSELEEIKVEIENENKKTAKLTAETQYIANYNPTQTPTQNIPNPTPTQQIPTNLQNYVKQISNIIPQQMTYNQVNMGYNYLIQANSNNIHILDKNTKTIMKKLKTYQIHNDCLIATLIMMIAILLNCNPIIFTISYYIIPKDTSDKQQKIMLIFKIFMIFSWIYTILTIILIIILCLI